MIEILSDISSPMTAREVFEKSKASKVKLDKVTVYRVLERFEDLGLIHQIFPSGGYVPCFHKDCSSSHHILMHCLVCENILEIDVPEDTIEPIAGHLKKEYKFTLDENHFQLNGVCGSCSPAVV